MKVLLDTNILLDFYTRREPFFEEMKRFRIAAYFGDIELWAAAQSFVDIEYILRHDKSVEEIRAIMQSSLEFIQISAPAASDIFDAIGSDWPDLEDFVIARCAERIKADWIITRDKNGFLDSKVPACAPLDFFKWLEEVYGVEYEDIEF